MRTVPPDSADVPGVYVHIPFCAVKCTYCDFPIAAGQDHRVARYLDALYREIGFRAAEIDEPVDSVFVGGGTPSRLAVGQLDRLLSEVKGTVAVADRVETTIEANPEDLSAAQLAGIRAAGFDRVSVGVQSLDDDVLRRCSRGHDGAQGLRALRGAVEAGFRSVSVDLIAGLPGERLERWGDTLDRVVDAGPQHVSVYLLELDGPTVLAKQIARGHADAPDPEALADAYEVSVERLAAAGFAQYEISNFAVPGHRSRHNEKYWSDAWYIGFGVGAHSYIQGERCSNVRGLTRYLRAVERDDRPRDEVDAWDPIRRLEEALFLGLRRTDGVDLDVLGARYGVDLLHAFEGVWQRHSEAGLVDVRSARVRLTDRGRIRSNSVFRDLIGHLVRTPVRSGVSEEP